MPPRPPEPAADPRLHSAVCPFVVVSTRIEPNGSYGGILGLSGIRGVLRAPLVCALPVGIQGPSLWC